MTEIISGTYSFAVCPHCNGTGRVDPAAATAALVEQLRAACLAAGHRVSADGRVNERAAAELQGVEAATLRNRRYINGADSLPFFKHGRTVTYALQDIAESILAGRVR